MTEAGDTIRLAMQRHQASMDAARETANALAAEREQEAASAAESAGNRHSAADSLSRGEQ